MSRPPSPEARDLDRKVFELLARQLDRLSTSEVWRLMQPSGPPYTWSQDDVRFSLKRLEARGQVASELVLPRRLMWRVRDVPPSTASDDLPHANGSDPQP